MTGFNSHPIETSGRASCSAMARNTAPQAFPAKKASDEDVNLLQSLMAVPLISQVWCKPSSTRDTSHLEVFLAHKDVANDKAIKTSRSVAIHGSGAAVGLPMPVADAAIVSISPSGRYRLIAKGGSPYVIEVWRGACKLHDIEVPASVHGSVYADSFFGHGFKWSADEELVAYVAERPLPSEQAKAPGRSGTPASSDAVAGSAKALKKQIEKDSEKQDDWGELNTKKQAPKVYILHPEAFTVREMPGQQDDTSYGQPCWTPTGGLLSVGWQHRSAAFPNLRQRLGLVYCFNRPCALHLCAEPLAEAAPQPLVRLAFEGGLLSAMEPRFSPGGSVLAFISHDQACEQGTHCAAAALHTAPWPPPNGSAAALPHTRVVGPVNAPEGDRFPGLYSVNLAASIFSEQPFLDEDTLTVNTLWRSTAAVAAVHVPSRRVRRLTPPSASYTCIASDGCSLFAVTSSMAALPGLARLSVTDARMHAHNPERGGDAAATPEWDALPDVVAADEVPRAVADLIADVNVSRRSVPRPPPEAAEGPAATVESLVLSRRSGGEGQARPVALFLHGGPHSACTDAFLPPLHYLLAHNFTVLLPNYRGSTGYGEDHLLALPGRAGSMDVEDCKAALDELLASGAGDASKVVVVGGSHGGFLTGHLLGQHASAFTCGVMRNPVLDIELMLTDIPDWCFVETMGPGPDTRGAATLPLTRDAAQRMHAASPVAHIDAVRAPVLMFLGAKDRRVPSGDGLAYAASLRCRDHPVRVHMYDEDTHSLDKPQTSYDQWLTILQFFKMYT